MATDGLASTGTLRGTTWSVAIALSYFLISSPLAFIPTFDTSLGWAIWCTVVACVLTLPRLRMPRVPWAALPFLGFCLASALWSINRDVTIHFFGLYVALTTLAVVVAANVGTRVLSHGILGGAVIVMVTSIYAYWQQLPGSHVLAGSSGYMAGVGTNRNILAYTMIVAFPFAASFVPRGRWFRAGWVTAILLVLSGIMLAESATGIVAVCVVAAVAVVLGWRDHLAAAGRAPSRRYWAILAGTVLALTVVGLVWYEALHRDLQRDLSFTGRSLIWQATWDTSTGRTRAIGDGFGTVWMHPWRPAAPNGPFEDITTQLGYYVPHAHNSVMALLPEVGLVGAGLFALVYVVPMLRAVARSKASSDATVQETSRMVVLGLLALVLAGVTEPLSTVPLGFYVAVLLSSRDPNEAAPAPAPAPDPPARRAPGRRRGPQGRAR